VSKIFISHSSANNASALAVGTWLAEVGWSDYFLDITPSRGLTPGERWQEALKAAAGRCQIVLFLISPAWQSSRWCQAEFLLAKQLGKTIFGVVIETTPFDELPRELVSEWQLCDLVSGASRRDFQVAQEPTVPATVVSFAQDGLTRLRRGLLRAGLDPASFLWPPQDDPQRAPYRGLKPLDVQDAAVYFGREAAIVRGLDAIRATRERGVESLFVILGASGAGKSSFLRAGLLPRLLRDDRTFLALPVIRPGRAAISGATGAAASFESALRAYGISRSRAWIIQELRSPGGIRRLLDQLSELASSRLAARDEPPTIVFSIDQGEELFGSEGDREAGELLHLLGQVLSRRERAGTPAQSVLAIIVIRSDSYERLQTTAQLQHVSPFLFSLPPIVSAEYKAVIEGPARRQTEAGRELTVDPLLTETLVTGATGADALPLLAFTLERLFVEHGGDGNLRLGEYEALGGVRGSIEAAVAAAFAEPGRDPAVPAEAGERDRLLREGFIPWLAGVDPDTEQPKRRVAKWDELPSATHPLIVRLIEQRLLVLDRRKLEGKAESVVVEIAHEALLRQWPLLTNWLREDGEALKVLDGMQRAAVEYARHKDAAGGSASWLVHTGERLAAAQALRQRADFDRLLGVEGHRYLDACAARDERMRREEEARAESERRALERELEQSNALALAQRHRADEQAKAGVRQRRLARGLVVLLVLSVAAGMYAWQQRDVAQQQQRAAESGELAADALNILAEDPERGLLLALEAASLGQSTQGDISAELEGALHQALQQSRARLRLGGDEQFVRVLYSPDGRTIAAAHNGGVKFWDSVSGRELPIELQGVGKVVGLTFSSDGTQLITGGTRDAVVWDLGTGRRLNTLSGDTGLIYTVASSSDGRRVATGSRDGPTKIWSLTAEEPLATFSGHDKLVTCVAFDRTGTRLISGSMDGRAIVWDETNGRPTLEIAAGTPLTGCALSPDGAQLASVGTAETKVRVWELASGRELFSMDGHTSSVMAVAYSPDGRRLATASLDRTVRVWSVATRKELYVLRGHSGLALSISFSPDGSRLVSASEGGGIIVWDLSDDAELTTVRGHSGTINQVAFSPNGQWLATASEDGTARVWDAATGEERRVLAAHSASVQAVAFSPDGSRLASGGADNTARIYDTDSGRELLVLRGHQDMVNGVAFNPDGSRLATGSADGTAKVWNSSTGEESATFVSPVGRVLSVDFSRDGLALAVASSDDRGDSGMTAQLWDLESNELLRTFNADSLGVSQIAFSPDGTLIATAGTSPPLAVKIWNAANGSELSTLLGHTGGVLSVAFSPDGSRLVTGGYYATAKLWDVASGQPRFDLPGLTGAVHSVVFSPDGRRVATAGNDWLARVHAASGDDLTRSALLRVTRALTDEECRQYLHANDCSDRATSLFVAATASERLGEPQAALTNLRRVAQRLGSADPETDARRLLAAMMMTEGRERARTGDLDGAIKSFENAREWDATATADPHREAATRVADTQVALASALTARGLLIEAVDKLRAAVTLDPQSDSALSALGFAYNDLERYDEAIATRRELIATHPTAVNLTDLGASYRLKGEYTRAIEASQRSVDIAPERERGRRELGRALLADEQFEKAIVELDAAARISPSVATYLDIARAYRRSRRYDSAIDSIDKAKSVDAASPEPYRLAGLVYHEELRDFGAAYREFERAVALEPSDVGTKANFAEACLTAGRFDEAYRIARELLEPSALEEVLPEDDGLALRFIVVASLRLQGRREEANSAQMELTQHMKPRVGEESDWDYSGTRLFIQGRSTASADRASLLQLLAQVEESEYKE
jgi:WD40 repeat protein/tetratricopeptide (TPR) repeat protein